MKRSYTQQNALIKCTIRPTNTYTRTPHPYEDSENFHHPTKILHAPSQQTPAPQRNLWFAFCHHSLVLSILEFHINIIIHFFGLLFSLSTEFIHVIQHINLVLFLLSSIPLHESVCLLISSWQAWVLYLFFFPFFFTIMNKAAIKFLYKTF